MDVAGVDTSDLVGMVGSATGIDTSGIEGMTDALQSGNIGAIANQAAATAGVNTNSIPGLGGEGF